MFFFQALHTMSVSAVNCHSRAFVLMLKPYFPISMKPCKTCAFRARNKVEQTD